MKKKLIGNYKLDSYEHDKLIFPHKRKQYQKSRNKKARKRYYKAVWNKWWTTVDWDVFWDFMKDGC